MKESEVEAMCSDCPFYVKGRNCRPWITPLERERRVKDKFCDSSGVYDSQRNIVPAIRYNLLGIWYTKVI